MASEIMLQEMQNLGALDNVLNAKSDLPAFLIKPVQRICKYPLLLESLVKAVKGADYPYFDELQAGVAAAKRITDKINEAQRRAENNATVKNLEGRVEDWKGHHISNFGSLLLDDIFTVTKSEVDREYHVFLFQKIILCCKEYTPTPGTGKKVGKSNSILKKPIPPPPLVLPGAGPSKKKSTPLLLKGRIFLNNVTQAVPRVSAGQYSLAVWWRGDDDLEFFTLRCRNEEQLKMWENQLNRLIQETASRRTSSRDVQRVAHISHNTLPSQQRQPPSSYNQERTFSVFSQSTAYSASSPYHSGGFQNGRTSRHPYAAEEQQMLVSSSNGNGQYSNGYSNGPQGYPPHDGFDVDPDEEYEDYPPSSYPPSGRGTPLGPRRSDYSGYAQSSRNSAQSAVHPSAMASYNGTTYGSPRPSISRGTGSYTPENSGSSSGTATSRGTLRSQFSSTRLKSAYDQGEVRPTGSPRISSAGPTSFRSRSASQPTAYMPNTLPPPLPTSVPWANRSQSSMGENNKRGSGSSQSTGDSSDYSPHSGSSPITPFGSSDSSLAGMPGSRNPRSQHVDKIVTSAADQLSGPVKVKVHFHEDIFVIQVPRMTEYTELVEKVGKKIRLCGPRRDDGPLRVKYKDEDGDLVSLGSTEDVQMAFESFRPGNQVTLYVQ
ncbi:hypothetical protein AcW1_010367 [Taiwanofungus camphoratus]|nr:hypothetical protein AcV5_010503 [Antrodia cinnamomea]KAI0949445.1 hypothetical protein AcW1_010367 [Antrodia cinnamomea]